MLRSGLLEIKEQGLATNLAGEKVNLAVSVLCIYLYTAITQVVGLQLYTCTHTYAAGNVRMTNTLLDMGGVVFRPQEANLGDDS